jgi:hypothetical protein
MTIAKFLDLGTRYITATDAALLDQASPDGGLTGLIVRRHDYGRFIHVPLEPAELATLAVALKAHGYSDAFVGVISYASNHECWWANLDVDGEDEADLPNFDW